MKHLLLTLLLLSCSREKHPAKDNASNYDLSAFIRTGDMYCELSRPAYETTGYVHSKCDGSGFTSLYSLRCPNVDLARFSSPNGKLYRSPTRDCLKLGQSKSESSRDMVLMRAVAAWFKKDVEWLDSFISYFQNNTYKFCDHDGSLDGRSRCIMTPRLATLLVDMRAKISSQKLTESRDILPQKVGFAAHLEVLRIWLEGQVYGKINASDLDTLEKQVKRVPENCMFQAAYHRYKDGDMSLALKILADFPSTRLPNSEDYCTEYKWQRDPGKDWEPCRPVSQHSGADYNTCLFMVMENEQ